MEQRTPKGWSPERVGWARGGAPKGCCPERVGPRGARSTLATTSASPFFQVRPIQLRLISTLASFLDVEFGDHKGPEGWAPEKWDQGGWAHKGGAQKGGGLKGVCWWWLCWCLCLLVVLFVGASCWWCVLVVLVGGACFCVCGGCVQDFRASLKDPPSAGPPPQDPAKFLVFFSLFPPQFSSFSLLHHNTQQHTHSFSTAHGIDDNMDESHGFATHTRRQQMVHVRLRTISILANWANSISASWPKLFCPKSNWPKLSILGLVGPYGALTENFFFVSFSRHRFVVSMSFWGSSRGIKRCPCTCGVLGLSCAGTTTREFQTRIGHPRRFKHHSNSTRKPPRERRQNDIFSERAQKACHFGSSSSLFLLCHPCPVILLLHHS